MNVLIIEDDIRLANVLQAQLVMASLVDISTSAREGLSKAAVYPYDVYLLNASLPDMDGVVLCRQLRSENPHTPILVIGGTDNIDIKIKVLDAGANDYIVKPFNISELNARIRAISRFLFNLPESSEDNDTLVLDPVSRTVKRSGQPIELRKKEFDILHYMFRHAGKVVSRNTLIDQVWGPNTDSCSNMVDVHFNYLRKKVDKPFQKKLLHTVHGIGYVLKVS